MAIFTKNAGEKLLRDVFSFHAEVQEEGTGKSSITIIMIDSIQTLHFTSADGDVTIACFIRSGFP